MKTSNTPPGHYWVETQDGSATLFSEAFQEACHSTSGARQETQLHYIQGTKIVERFKEVRQLSILEVGFGLGIGFLETYESLKSLPGTWRFLSLEIDEKLLEWFRQENCEHDFLKHLKWSELSGGKILSAKNEQTELTVLCGDARQVLPQYLAAHPQTWNSIYQDAFSPKRNPVLWTKEWFELLKSHSAPDALLSTYSASTSIRKSLHESGWSFIKVVNF